MWPGWIRSNTPPTRTTLSASRPINVSLLGSDFSIRPILTRWLTLPLYNSWPSGSLALSLSYAGTEGSSALEYSDARTALSNGSIYRSPLRGNSEIMGDLLMRSEEHTSELQSRGHLV